jgi:subtilisin
VARGRGVGILVASLLVLAGFTSAPVQAAGPQTTDSGESYIVTFGGGGSVAVPRRALAEAHDRDLDRVADRAITRLRISPSLRYRHAVHGFAASLTPAQLRALRRDPDVRSITPDRVMSVDEDATPGTPGVDATQAGFIKTVTLTHQVIPSGIRRVRADDSPVADIDGHDDRVDVDVGILDTGIDPNPDLNIRGGHDCLSPFPDAIRDRNGHGTHVAGIIGAIDNDRGVVGMAPGARLWSVRVADDNGNARTSWYLCGVDWVMSQRDPGDASKPLIEVVNMSVSGLLQDRDDRDCGSHIHDALHEAICASVADGTTYVVAAGNQSTNADTRLPGAYDEVITVAAMADYDGKPGGLAQQSDYCPWYSRNADDAWGVFSNYGPDVDIIAPGKCILSTYLHGQWGYMTGTSMATPTVTGGAALYIASHPGVRPGQVRAALRHVASTDWRRSTRPADTTDLLLDVHAFDDPPAFSLDGGGGTLRLGRGGRLEVPIDVTHRNGHTHSVALSATDLSPGIDAGFRDGADGGRILVLRASDDADTGDVSMTVRGTDGELSRSLAVDFHVSGGERITFDDPSGNPLVVTPTDPIPVSFIDSGDPADPDPPTRWVQRQWGAPVNPGSCNGVAWVDQGAQAHPDDLDTGTTGDLSWEFTASGLPRDGCYRWAVSLVDTHGDPATWTSGTALVDGTPPRRPGVRATGSRVWQSGVNGLVWVRGGSGTVVLTALDRDLGSGTVQTHFGALSRITGWTYDPGTVNGEPASRKLRWSSAAAGTTSLDVTGTDAVSLDGAERHVTITVDRKAPSAATWSEPQGFRTTFQSPELRWRPGTDSGSGSAAAQLIQRQRAKVRHTDSCSGLHWSNDGAARTMSRPAEATGLRSGYCYRWRITSLDRVGNRGPTRTSGTLLYDGRAPRGDFIRANEGTSHTQTGSSYRLTWTESEHGGSGGLTRALERERKKRAADGTCSSLLWRQDGSTLSVHSGYAAKGLAAGYCYRWRLILQDRAGNVTTDISGIIKRRP